MNTQSSNDLFTRCCNLVEKLEKVEIDYKKAKAYLMLLSEADKLFHLELRKARNLIKSKRQAHEI